MSGTFKSPKPLPNEHQQELLTILMEECNEVAIRASKLKRFGKDEVQPGQSLTNGQRLAFELGDIYAMVNLLCAQGVVYMADIAAGIQQKEKQLAKFLQTKPGD